MGWTLVRRDREGRELSAVPVRYIPPAFTAEVWAGHLARVQSETLKALVGPEAGDWRAEKRP